MYSPCFPDGLFAVEEGLGESSGGSNLAAMMLHRGETKEAGEKQRLSIRGPRTRVRRLWLLRLRPDPFHASPSRGPLIDRQVIICTRWQGRRQREGMSENPHHTPPGPSKSPRTR